MTPNEKQVTVTCEMFTSVARDQQRKPVAEQNLLLFCFAIRRFSFESVVKPKLKPKPK